MRTLQSDLIVREIAETDRQDKSVVQPHLWEAGLQLDRVITDLDSQNGYVVSLELRVVGDDGCPFHQCLRDQHPIERVAMV